MKRPGTSLARGERLRELCLARLDAVTLRRELRRELYRLLPFDAYCINCVDPETQLVASSVGDGLSGGAARRLFELEELGAGYNLLRDLARAGSAATLSAATLGDVRQSARMRELFWPLGLRDELRAALVLDGHCWGYLHLFRGSAFTPVELARVSAVTPLLATGLRASCVTGARGALATSPTPTVLLLDAAGAVTATNAAASSWLPAFEHDVGAALPHALIAAHQRTRRTASASLRHRTRDGAWLSLHGSRLGGGEGAAALVLGPPVARELRSLLTLAYGLSAREREVATLALDGHANDAIAALLDIGMYTAKDHLKAIYRKTATEGRAELAARLGA